MSYDRPGILREASNPVIIVRTGVITGLVYLVGLAVYRLYLSPIAKFPGPKIVALSRWYEIYCEIILRGQFEFKIQKWHDQYGPIVRISPEEIHIRDSEFWDEVFVRNPRIDRFEPEKNRFANPEASLGTIPAAIHKRRRAVLNPMFSRQQILGLQPLVQEKVDRFCKKLEEYCSTNRPLRFDHAASAFAGDVIMEYSFGFCYNQLESPEFSGSFHESYMEAGKLSGLSVHFPTLNTILRALPDKWITKVNPELSALLHTRQDLGDLYQAIAHGTSDVVKDKSRKTVFGEIWNSDLPDSDKSRHRIIDEAQAVTGGGVITTAWTACHFAFHVISNPNIHKTLFAELVSVWPDPSKQLDVLILEQLPYLRGCIQESLRLSYGISHRLTRVHNNQTIQYKGWVLPKGTPVAMSIIDVCHDEAIFPDSHSFIPERWLDGAKAPNGVALAHYLPIFGKGSRSCLGINLAYQEFFLMLGTLFRRFQFELFETDETDVKMAHDYVTPGPRGDSKGVRVKIISLQP